tara:strand:- start:900 stop:6026 length:5127 start_codon:yes stop_codon:yes gene_type:complete
MRTNYNSRYKIHNKELSARDVLQKKKERILNKVEENDGEYNSDLKKKGNQIVSVSNYNTYNSITRPKHNHTFSSEILSGHNVFKYVNENGKICDKNRTLTMNNQCITSSIQEHVFLNETYNDMTNYLDDNDAQLIQDMIENEVFENERSSMTFSLVFNSLSDLELVDNDGSRNEIIDSIYSTLVSDSAITISRSNIRIIDIRAGSVIVDIAIITTSVEDSQKILDKITEGNIYPNTGVLDTIILYDNLPTYYPVTIPPNPSLNEDSSCNIYLSVDYYGPGTRYYKIVTIPDYGKLYNINTMGDYISETNGNIDILFDNSFFHYEPDINYYGHDSFTYKVRVNSLDSEIVTVNITVHGINDEPDSSSCNISGEFKQGFILNASVIVTDQDNLSSPHFSDISYHWQFADYISSVFTDIIGANDASYQIPDTKEYVNKYIRLKYTTIDDDDNTETYFSDASLVANVNHPCIVNIIQVLNTSGIDVTTYGVTPIQGDILDVSFSINDEDVSSINSLSKYSTDVSFSYQWYRNDNSYNKPGSLISNANDSFYTLTSDDITKYIYVYISYDDGYSVDNSFSSNFTNEVISNGMNSIYFDPSSDINPQDIYTELSYSFDLSSVVDPFGDYTDINYRILAKSGYDYSDWSADNFTGFSAFNGWSFDSSIITVTPTTATFNAQIHEWTLYNYIELRLEAYSSSSPDISAIYTIKYRVILDGSPIWSNFPGSIPNIYQGDSFIFDISISIPGITEDPNLDVSLITQSSWLDYSYNYPNVIVYGTPSNDDVGTIIFTLGADLQTDSNLIPVEKWFSFQVLNIDDIPSVNYINIIRAGFVILSTSDIYQNDVLDMSFAITDIDVSTNSFNENNISNFFTSSDKYQYQWYRDDSVITGANSISYTLLQGDVNSYIWVDISYTDQDNFSFDISSVKYGPVINVNDAVSGHITFTIYDNHDIEVTNNPVTLYEDYYIVADLNNVDDDDGFDRNNADYQWYRNSSPITGANNASYTLVQVDVGCIISLEVSYTDNYSNVENISNNVSDNLVQNINDDSTLNITITYEHLMIGYTITGTLNWSMIDEDGIQMCEYQFEKITTEGTTTTGYVIQSWQSITSISTSTNNQVSIILPDDTVGYYIRLKVKVEDLYNNYQYFTETTPIQVSPWSYMGTSDYFFSRNGRVVNSTVQNCVAQSFILLTKENIGDANLTTNDNGECELSFTRTPARYYSYNDFLIVSKFHDGNVTVMKETQSNISEATPVQNKDFFYKVFRVHTPSFDSNGDPIRDISDNSTSSDLISFGVINSACNAVVFELTLEEFQNYFSSIGGSITTHPNPTTLLLNIWDPFAENPNSTSGDINFTDLRPYFGNESYDYILESCADFVVKKIEEKQNIVINALGINNEEIDKNPYDIVKMEAFHTICTSIVNSVLSRNVDVNDNIIPTEDKEILCRNTYIKILHYLEPGNLAISFSISNKDSVTNYISEVISNIKHYDMAITAQEMQNFRSFMQDTLKPFLINIGREMVDDTFDSYIDDTNYISSIKKSRSLISGVNLRTIDMVNSNFNRINLLEVSQELSSVRNFIVPRDVVIPPVLVKLKYHLDYEFNKVIYMKAILNNNIYNFAIWYEASGISMADIEDYPSLTHYDIVIKPNIDYTFKTNDVGDNKINTFIRFESDDGYIRQPPGFHENPMIKFNFSGNVLVTNYLYENDGNILPTRIFKISNF